MDVDLDSLVEFVGDAYDYAKEKLASFVGKKELQESCPDG